MTPDASTSPKPTKNAAPPPSNGAPVPSSDGASKAYQPATVEPRITAKWAASKAFHADPAKVLSGQKKPYAILIPPPNVTGALHLGHALNNTLQDILTRAHRMMGFETLWMPGTDHAGIATQAVVERRLKKEQNKTRKDFTREQFIALVQEWKDEYEARITGQLKAMGCSCDFDRQRFTMDDICARAVREAFFRLFKDGLIYRGKRLVNWDPALQTAVADDECYEEEHDTFFYYLRYPLVRSGKVAEWPSGKVKQPSGSAHSATLPLGHSATPVTWDELATLGYPGAEQHPPDQPAWITVATTRPETYLGDTAVAVNPKDHRAKSLRGLFVELPLVGRVIPIVEDDYVVLPAAMWPDPEEAKNDPKAQYATGFLKVTPAHDQNDYELGMRHTLPMVNVFAPDASISDKHGWSDAKELEGAHIFLHKSREDARKLVIREFEARGLLEKPRPYRQSLKHSDRSKAVIEPYLSDQWYIRVTDDRLSGAANRALVPEQRTSAGKNDTITATKTFSVGTETISVGTKGTSAGRETTSVGTETPSLGTKTPFVGTEIPSAGTKTPSAASKTAHGAAGEASTSENNGGCGDGSMRFYPARYAKTYEQWHDNIRDWCISRQLWWGHRIPVWRITLSSSAWLETKSGLDRPTPQGNAFNALSNLIVKLSAEEAETTEILGVDPNIALKTSWKERAPTGEPEQSRSFFICARSSHADAILLRLQEELERRKQGKYVVGDYQIAAEYLDSIEQDPDVLDTWFSSALWPLSTMGWPDPAQSPQTKDLLAAFNPTTVLSTAREIITLWVSRMVMMNRYFRGTEGRSDGATRGTAQGQTPPSLRGSVAPSLPGHGPVPFHDVFIHAVVQDGEGKKMSKTAGNGVDPLDIIESHGADAMRYTLAQMTTNTQDVRMPVRTDARTGKNTSEKFDAGRNFCNKLWNASRFAMAILDRNNAGSSPSTLPLGHSATLPLSLPDRWLLSRLAKAVRACETSLASYEFSDYCQTIYQLLWWDFCDWYLEAIKPTVDKDANQRAVLRAALDVIIRLLHPVAPFITEEVHAMLRGLGTPVLRTGSSSAVSGIDLTDSDLLCTSSWPKIDAALIDEPAEQSFESLRELITAIRNVRSEHQVLPKRRVTLHCSSAAATRITSACPGLVENLAGLEAIAPAKPAQGAAHVAFRASGEEMYLSNLADAIDAGAEKDRLTKQLEQQKKNEAALAGRLNNPGYADKAPPKLVEESKAQLAKIRAEIAAIEAKLKTL